MRTILNSILLMSLCSSATAPAMAINGADNNKEKSSFHGMETSDSIKHQPLTESGVKLNDVVVTGLTGSLLPTSSMPSLISQAFRRLPREAESPSP